MTVMPPSMSVAKRPMSTQLCGSVTVVTFPVCGRSLQDAKVPVPPGVGEAAWDCTADRIALGRNLRPVSAGELGAEGADCHDIDAVGSKRC